MPIRLHSLEGNPSIALDKPILLIGRHPECDVQIESRKISRRHCCIAHVNDAILIRDLESTNGVKINGVRVKEGRINLGDEVAIGGHLYRVTEAAEAEPQPRKSPFPAPANQNPFNDQTFDEDALLESSEVPVPIQEPPGTHEAYDEDASSRTAGVNDYAIIPDVLNLAPPSENLGPLG